MGTTNFKLIGWAILLFTGIICLGYSVYQLATNIFSVGQILGIRCIIVGLTIQIVFSATKLWYERRQMSLY
jgi:hypothetical protein